MDRRDFNRGLGAAALAAVAGEPVLGAGRKMRDVVYNSVGNTLTHWELDVERAALIERGSLVLPSVVQYGWPHPSQPCLYVATTDSERGAKGITGSGHFLFALRPDGAGDLMRHGEPQRLRQRPINVSVDRGGRFILCAYNAPGHVSVHRIEPDGMVGPEIVQPDELDVGVFTHQILATPSNRAVIVPSRGNNPSPGKPKGDPGAIKLFHFANGHLSNWASIEVGGDHGYGYGPRHLDFHPNKPWLYVLVELQNQLHMHRLSGDMPSAQPAYAIPCTKAPMVPGVVQVAGAIHVHPKGNVVYASNRVSATTSPVGAFPFTAGENNIAVFAIDQTTGEPRPIQFADPHGFHVRAFTIDPSGKVLIAACLAAMSEVKDGEETVTPAGLSLFRIAEDGTLTFANRYDIELEPGVQQMWVRAMRV
ncbi:beta-propeller fold lactonase family protein [Novosphingobium flavum]|uniref:Beta-propeller fold lactonase family protein n=1 Tax=Novosphingobium flavum TaxID=1778672 RepID=A0A7X1FUS2_9SPHN|nr:beta-propeller fold lactonase family protein [Novosphingobium flavum]MBC2667369.1 beta-propeller fold lactonase family protein [Novosphingobium flavum]